MVHAAQPLRVRRRGMGKWVWKNRRRFQPIALLNESRFSRLLSGVYSCQLYLWYSSG